MTIPRPRRGAARAGFTLIEILAVIVILSILSWFLLTNVFETREAVESQAVRARLAQLAAALSDYELDQGDWAPSAFAPAWGPPPNNTNLGAECLYLVLCAEGEVGEGRFDEDPGNLDGDASAMRLPGHDSLELFEIVDEWGNPIAYFHHRDYEREDTYLTWDRDSGELVQSTVRARRNPKTGRWYEPRRFQLLSAGPNGVFDEPGSEGDDDISSFSR